MGPSNLMNNNRDDVVDLREYYHLITSNFWKIFAFAGICSALAILIIFSLKPVYRGSATLLIESNDANIVSIEGVYDLGMRKSEYYGTQFEILKSRELAHQVIERHKVLLENLVKKDAPFYTSLANSFFPTEALTEDEKFKESAVFFMENISVVPLRGTQLVTVSFDSEDPEAAAILANELAKVYIEDNLESRLAMTQQAATWLAGRIDGLKEKLKNSESRLQQYREAEDLVNMEGAQTLAAKELEEISSKLSEARKQRVQAENIALQIGRLSDRNSISTKDIEALSAIPAVLQHSLVQRFKEQEANSEQRLSELSKRYGYKHPKIIAAKSELDSAKQNTANQIHKVVEGVHKEHEVAKATEQSLTVEVNRLKDLVQKTSRKQYQLDELTREVAVDQQLYETFFSRIKETSESGDLQTANARVIDPAVVPVKPIKPKRALLSILFIFLSVFIGTLLVILREALDSTVKSRDDVIVKLHTQLLGVLPLLKEKEAGGNVAQIYSKAGNSTFPESIRTIRTGVILSGIDNPHKILVVTSSIPGEGKSTIAANLAQAFGQMGKTLLIDADLRRPTVFKNFGIKPSAPGLSDLVADTAEIKACIHRLEAFGIDVMPSGMVPPNPLELLSSKRFAAVLASLEKHYDRIIIDSAPCEVVSDALILATFASALIYVVKADATNIRAVKSGIGRLRESGTPVTGVVMNCVNLDKKSSYGYGRYYGGYYDYYGYSGVSRSGEKSTDLKGA
jgi:succinoglycan biosynthesis transport protein ExoP